MATFGDEFRLTLLTNDPALATKADHAGVDRIGLDLERLGKAERQAGEDTRLSDHRIEELATIARAIERAALFVRLNPVNPGTGDEIEAALQFGAAAIMLPYFRTAAEVETFVRQIKGRAAAIVLVETASALVRIREILAVPGIDEVMAGLNDLRLELGVHNHFEVLASPLLDTLAREVRNADLAFSVGGVARPGDLSLPVSPELIFAQYPRLGATGAWISRSFFLNAPPDWDFAAAVPQVRRRLDEWAAAPAESLERARQELAERARDMAARAPPRGRR
jgi:hypothetical protein